MVMSVSGILAMNNSTNGSIATGKVDIDIKEFTVNSDNEEILYTEENKVVKLGDSVTLMPRIYNLGSESYIRAKIILENTDTDISNWVSGISDDWEKVGDYYYYISSVNKNSYIQLFDTIKFPEIASNSSVEYRVSVVAEAVQAQNFEQDLNLENPWKNVEIEKMVDTSYIVNDEKTSIQVEYANGSDRDITISNDLFEGYKQILPGDTIIGNVKIVNNSKDTNRYYLTIRNENISDEQKELLKKLNLKIKDENELIIYDGNLIEVSNRVLAELQKNKNKNLIFELTVPVELNNSFVGIDINPIFLFSIGVVDEKNIVDEITENGGSYTIPSELEDFKENVPSKKTNPKTWDSGIDWFLILFFSSSIGLITVILSAYEEKKKN